MSDLISRSELIRRSESEYREYGEDYDVEQILGDIEDMQTAYDIDKVVEELENNSFITVKQEEVQTKRKDIQSYIAVEKEVVLLKDAKEIVKQGGVADDVCEWECKYINDKYSYLTSCGNIFIYETNSVYCPYCGKKIKVVE